MIRRRLLDTISTWCQLRNRTMSLTAVSTVDTEDLPNQEQVPDLVIPSRLPDSPTLQSSKSVEAAATGSSSRKRPHGPDLRVPGRKKKPQSDDITDVDQLGEVKFYFENGLRKVEPYYFTWKTFAKGRWIGRSLEDVFRDEFLACNDEVTEARIHADPSNCFINGVRTDMKRKIQNSDYIAHYMHRHECPVTDQPIKIVAETDDMLVVDKPASIPVHPCGRFRANTVINILALEFGRTKLRVMHRLDRLTSGLLIFSKNLATSQGVAEQMLDRSVQKEYVARVAGRFPDQHVTCGEAIECVNIRAGIYQVRPTGRHSVTEFDRLSYDEVSDTSIVHCKPRTGRTHQIRVHLQYIGFPIANDPYYGPKSSFTGKGSEIQLMDVRLGADFTEECQKQTFSKYDALPDRPWIDAKCPECWVNFTDPVPEDMRIDLHAWKYEGPGWKFETDLPFWAKDVTVPLPSAATPPEVDTVE